MDDNLLRDQIARAFEDIASKADRTFSESWDMIEAVGIDRLMLPEEDGGFGGDWAALLLVEVEAARLGLSLPIGDAIAARWLARQAGLTDLPGFGTLGFRAKGVATGDRYDGRVYDAAFGRYATWIVFADGTGKWHLVSTDGAECHLAANLAGTDRDSFVFTDAHINATITAPIAPAALCALLRFGEMLGAFHETQRLTVDHVRTRRQFGKPLGSFQAIQQQVAVLVAEVAAADCAIRSATLRAVERSPANAEWAIGAAKMRANLAIDKVTGIAHQLHGAIGFTEEHNLHRHTRRLMALRTEGGNDRFWGERLGSTIVDQSADCWQFICEA